MSEWREYRLDEIGQVVGGGTPSSKVNAYWNGDVGWVTPADLSGYQFKHIGNGSRDITELGLKKSSAKLHPKNTVLMTSRAPIGYLAIADKPVATNQGFQSIRCNEDIADFNFIYYLLGAYKEGIALIASGATFPEVSGGKVRQYKIKLPPLPTQQKIAKILSNYDDLIENNLKRIKLLEESARLTYEEWFLRFRVDGKKLDIDAATNLPFGWEYSGLNNISTFTNGYAFKSKDFVEYGHPVIKIKNIDGKMVDVHNTNRISANDVLKVNDKFKLHEGDLLIAMTGATVGKLGFVPYSNDACYLNQRVGKIQSEYLFFTFLALSGTSGQKQILNFAGGAAQPNISGDQILAVKNIIPAKDILDKFELLSNNALSQILNFTRKNQLLKEARDILLPRLMTGMIDTDDMDIAV
jgi:type I restriction enzyme S subunit